MHTQEEVSDSQKMRQTLKLNWFFYNLLIITASLLIDTLLNKETEVRNEKGRLIRNLECRVNAEIRELNGLNTWISCFDALHALLFLGFVYYSLFRADRTNTVESKQRVEKAEAAWVIGVCLLMPARAVHSFLSVRCFYNQ